MITEFLKLWFKLVGIIVGVLVFVVLLLAFLLFGAYLAGPIGLLIAIILESAGIFAAIETLDP